MKKVHWVYPTIAYVSHQLQVSSCKLLNNNDSSTDNVMVCMHGAIKAVQDMHDHASIMPGYLEWLAYYIYKSIIMLGLYIYKLGC